MGRRALTLVLVLLLLAVAATPVLAEKAGNGQGQAQNQPKEPQTAPGEQQRQPKEQHRWVYSDKIFSLVGTVTAVGEGSITVQVIAGNRNVKEYVGEELTVLLSEDLKVMQWTGEGCVPAELADVEQGDSVNVYGAFDGEAETYTATRVTVDVPLKCLATPV